MTEPADKLDKLGRRPRKTGFVHGVRAWIDEKRLPSGRQFKQAMRDHKQIKDELIAEFGGADRIPPSILLLVDGAADAWMVGRLCLLYIKKSGILNPAALQAGDMKLHSILEKSYASYANTLRLNLLAAAQLQESRKAGSEIIDLGEYIEAKDAETAAAETEQGFTAKDGQAKDQDQGQNPRLEVGQEQGGEAQPARDPGQGDQPGPAAARSSDQRRGPAGAPGGTAAGGRRSQDPGDRPGASEDAADEHLVEISTSRQPAMTPASDPDPSENGQPKRSSGEKTDKEGTDSSEREKRGER